MKMLYEFKVVAAFDEIVESASRRLVIVTPYFDPWPHLTKTLLQKLERKVSVHFLVRGGEDRGKSEAATLPFTQRGARVQFLDRLHAKVYINERQALLTSMNLIKSSRDSWEVGTLFDAHEDEDSYQKIVEMTRELFATVGLTAAAGQAPPAPEARAWSKPAAPRQSPPRRSAAGFCIRCASEIPASPEKPLCRECYATWAEYGNEDYEEEFCHLCGRPWSSSMAKPLCRACWEQS